MTLNVRFIKIMYKNKIIIYLNLNIINNFFVYYQ